jgi:hypothetical protein
MFALVGLLVSAGPSQAQPAGPQGNGWISGGSNGFRSGGYGGGSYSGGSYYSAPNYYNGSATENTGNGYQSFYPAANQRSGWQLRPDGWYYYWSQNQVLGAYDGDSDQWYAREGSNWARPTQPPWRRR